MSAWSHHSSFAATAEDMAENCEGIEVAAWEGDGEDDHAGARSWSLGAAERRSGPGEDGFLIAGSRGARLPLGRPVGGFVGAVVCRSHLVQEIAGREPS
jgi:hypothetical protein